MMSDEDVIDTDGKEDPEQTRKVATFWKKHIEKEQEAHKDFRNLSEDAQKFYDKACTFNLMWPTVEIQGASLYSSTPNPEVMRRQMDGEKAQKDAAQVLERAIDYCLDSQDFDGNMSQAITDFLVAALGQVRVIYKPEFGKVPDPLGNPIDAIVAQCMTIEHFSWKHFGWQPATLWEDVDWVYFRHTFSKKQVRDKYNVSASEDDKDDDGHTSCKVYEIYHKPTRTVIVVADQFDVPLEIRQDDMGLSGFFPCPEPLFTNVKTDKLIPAADFKYYNSQVRSVDRVSKRLIGLVGGTKAIKFYDAHFQELAKYKTNSDGMWIPVENMLDKLSGSTLDNVMADFEIAQNVEMIELLEAYKQNQMKEVFEIVGIGDIMRAESNPQDGVETNKLKADFGAIRLRKKQGQVDRFIRDIFRIMAEVIAEHFEPEVLQKMTGVQIDEQVMTILRDDALRNFSVNVESDSTNALDKLRKKKENMEAMNTVIGGFSQILPGMQSGVISPQIGQELLLMIIRSQEISAGNLEDIISAMGEEGSPEQIIMQLRQQLAQLTEQAQQMQAELQKVDQASTAKDMSQTQLNQAKAQLTQAQIPGEMADTQLTNVEADGKRVEQAGNIAANLQGRPVNLRGIE